MDLLYEYRVFLLGGLIETLKMSAVVAMAAPSAPSSSPWASRPNRGF
nr:hypothetical protein [Cereibacter sphaeroides]